MKAFNSKLCINDCVTCSKRDRKRIKVLLVKLGSTTILKWNRNIVQEYVSHNLKHILLMQTELTGIYSSDMVIPFFE